MIVSTCVTFARCKAATASWGSVSEVLSILTMMSWVSGPTGSSDSALAEALDGSRTAAITVEPDLER